MWPGLRAWLAAVLALSCVGANEDHYRTLGVKAKAKETEIKKAYRELAKKWQLASISREAGHEFRRRRSS